MGFIDELCGPMVTSLEQQTAPLPLRLNTNEAVGNTNLVFPAEMIDPVGTPILKGFGCVSNTIGDYPSLSTPAALNKQKLKSSLLPKDPVVPSVSLWETMQSFMTLSFGGCLEGISTFNGHFAPYGGSVKIPLPVGSFIGDNAGVCTDATPQFANGRDNFYREFEIAFTKMTTVGYTYSHTFAPPTVTTYTDVLEAVTNNAINGISVFIDPATSTAKDITIAKANGKLGTLIDINFGSSSCATTYPTLCFPPLPSVAPTKAPSSLPSVLPSKEPSSLPSINPTNAPRVPSIKPTNAPRVPSIKPTNAPLSKKPTKAPVTKKPTNAPVTKRPTNAPI